MLSLSFAAVFFLVTSNFANQVTGLNISFVPSVVDGLLVDQKLNVGVLFDDADKKLADEIRDGIVAATVSNNKVLRATLASSVICEQELCNGTVELEGVFLGFSTVYITFKDGDAENKTIISPPLEVTVLREDTIMNKIFPAFVATIVTINFINMGCALDLDVVKEVLSRPIGPTIGFFCQYLIMPVVSYGVSYLLFEDPILRFGLFTFGCSPGGGASNMWTVLLGGNLNLSITMTFISTLAALGTIPIWLFTLGKTILTGTNITIPYGNILLSLVSLIVPIGIGLLIQKYFPKAAALSRRILAPVCIVLIIGIIVLASISYLYMFKMMTWRMVIAASLSVWTGFTAGIITSLIFRMSVSDTIAIAVETGIQNSGIAFVLLNYSLHHPVSDMASVVPVVGSIITPIPLFIVYCYQKIRDRFCRSEAFELQAILGENKSKETTLSSDTKENIKEH